MRQDDARRLRAEVWAGLHRNEKRDGLMSVPEAIAVLRAYNNWRRDNTGRVAFVDPVLIGQAIDLVCDAMTQDVAA